MRIAVLSGKGGTGKTLISVNLAAAAKAATYIDCDVEEPNGHLFFKPEQVVTEKVAVKIPVAKAEICQGCRKCIEFCQFNALAYINQKLLVFEEICHSCGGCVLLCPAQALTEKDKIIGEVKHGISENVQVSAGFLNTGEASGVPLIKQLLRKITGKKGTEITVLDCPPGSACLVMESIKQADYCVLVAEPTLFGVHNFRMVHELVRLLKKPHGAVLNKCLPGENPAEDYCKQNGIKILGRIPFEREIGTINSNGRLLAREQGKYRRFFAELLLDITKEVEQ